MNEKDFERAVVKVAIFQQDSNSMSIELNDGVVLGIMGDDIKKIRLSKVSDNYCQLQTDLLSAVIKIEDAKKLKELGATVQHGSL